MTLLDDTALAACRDTLEQLHVTSATHGRLAETVGADFSVSQDWTDLGDISCRVETDMGDQRQARVTAGAPADRPVYEYVVFVAHDADVRSGDHLTLASGLVLSVIQDSRGQSQPFVQALYCTEVAA